MKLVRKLQKLLGLRQTPHEKFLNFYLSYPVGVDVAVTIIILSINFLFRKSGIIAIPISSGSIAELLSELISTSMSLGGFVLAAMAIIASNRDGTRVLNNGEKPQSGRELFFNSESYGALMKNFSSACILYGASFLFFTLLKATSQSVDANRLFDLTFAGVFICVFTLFRSIFLIMQVIKIK